MLAKIVLSITAIWVLCFPLTFMLSEKLFSPIFDKVYDSLNVLFTALAFSGVLLTFYSQLESSRAARRAETERSIYELFSILTSSNFQPVKDAGYSVLVVAIKSRPYAEFLASRLFVVEQLPFPRSAEPVLRKHFTHIPAGMEIEAFDRQNRLMLDNVLNFFAMLAQRESAADVIKHCDFAYDWWRPALWLLAQLQEERHAKFTDIQKYCRAPRLRSTLLALDGIYGYEPVGKNAWAYVLSHPRMRQFGLDIAFYQPLPA